jgi:SRSO17 transposase
MVMKTYTPELDPAVLQRLVDYAALFAKDFPQAKPARWSAVYLQGLLLDGERKSIEPMAGRVTLPADLKAQDAEQALQQFVNQSPWKHQKVLRRYRSHLATTFASPQGVFVVDDTTFPKQGTHSVGVQRQYCGALGKRANCQAAVSVHYVSPKGHYPLALRLYLPESWTADHDRLRAAQVPLRYWRFRTKGQIALELLDQVRREGLPGQVVITDAGYGVSRPFRDGLAARGLFYVAGVTEDTVIFTEPPIWRPPVPAANGRPETLPHLDPQGPQPIAIGELARRTPLRRRTWREGTKGKLSGRFAWMRVWLANGWKRGQCAGAEPLWLLIEEQAGGTLKYALSNLPPDTPAIRAVRLWKSRWPVEQGYQQMKEELGLDHYEGRFWPGFHHHACLVMLAYGFLALEKQRLAPKASKQAEAVKKKDTGLTLPAVRRGLQGLLAPLARPDCPYCRPQISTPLLV